MTVNASNSWIEKSTRGTAATPQVDAAKDQFGNGSLAKDRALAVAGLSAALASFQFDANAGLQLIVNQAIELFAASGAAIAMTEGDRVVCVASAGSAPSIGAVLKTDSGVSGECFRTGKIVRCSDSSSDPRIHASIRQSLTFRSLVVVPIRDTKGMVGILEVLGPRPGQFNDLDITTLEQLCQLSAEIAGRRRSGTPSGHVTEFRTTSGSVLFRDLKEGSKSLQPIAEVTVARPSPSRDKRVQVPTSSLSDKCKLLGFMPDTVHMLAEIASELDLTIQGDLRAPAGRSENKRSSEAEPRIEQGKKVARPTVASGRSVFRTIFGKLWIFIIIVFIAVVASVGQLISIVGHMRSFPDTHERPHAVLSNSSGTH